MSRTKASMVRVVATTLVTLALSFTSLAQVQSREALDFDGDQRADFTVFRPDGNIWFVFSPPSGMIAQQWGLANEDRIVPGDYDGDNRADLSVFRDSEGRWYILNSADSTFSGIQWGIDGDEPVGRDFDGDGKTDRAVVRRSGGLMYWWVLKSTGGFDLFQWGLDIDFVCPGDYDGDGKFDLCVQRPGATPSSQAFFFILASTSGYMGAAWGISTDFSVPGDYDGDGKTDIAIVREGATGTDNLVWWILRSDGNGIFQVPWGLTASDYTTQGDYDGDGKTEISVWRKTDGTFYNYNPTTGVFTGARWGMDGDYPIATYDTH